MATDSHIRFELITGGRVTRGFRCGSVGLNIIDHRRASDPPSVLFPCPRRYSSPRLYRAAVEDIATDMCDNYLHLRPCCIALLLPQLLAKINAASASPHHCYRTHYAELHVFPESPTMANEILRESFEAAQPRTTPASRGWIEKIVAEKKGDDESSSSCRSSDDGSCMICLDDEIISRRSSLKMPYSHVFHQSCIVEWLKVSHVCPLCRYQMPVDDADNSDH